MPHHVTCEYIPNNSIMHASHDMHMLPASQLSLSIHDAQEITYCHAILHVLRDFY